MVFRIGLASKARQSKARIRIITRAEMRVATEIDAGQARGDITRKVRGFEGLRP